MKKELKKEVVILKCSECGEEFLYEWSGRGTKPKYCEKCKPIVVARSKQKYQDKQLKLKRLNKIEKIAKEEVSQPTIVTIDYEKKLIDILSKLDTLRVEMCNLSTELRQYQSGYDKNDQLYIHSLEDIDADNTQELIDFVKNWKCARNNRRNVKDLIAILSEVINVVPYKSVANAMSILRHDIRR